MLAAVLTCDFVISPAIVNADAVGDRIDDLVRINSLLQGGGHTVLIEDDAMTKLVFAGQYPTENLFEQRLRQAGITQYSPQDVAKIVNRILGHAVEISQAEPELILDADTENCEPAFDDIDADRRESLHCLLTNVAARTAFSRVCAGVLHSCRVNRFEMVEIGASIKYMIPTGERKYPLRLQASVAVHQSYDRFLDTVEGTELFRSSNDAVELKIAVFIAARTLRKSAGYDVDDFSLDSFGFGPGFFASLARNQCLPGHKFGNAAFDVASAIVSGCSDRSVSEFWSQENKGEARSYGKYKAYRTHITKGGEGLRLMFWRADNGFIVLANIGTKGELVIERP